MLVLSRKPGQTVIVGEDIHITIVSMEGGRVTIGIDAPKDQRILRGELQDRPDEPLIIQIPLPEGTPAPLYPSERTLL